ncbi:hypothetical protein [Nonomuraea cypriaca]|uniref:hypothetical protein n=1 Tax=Nonomuraea cypriaca TaxID=1187855 RepID=UPI0038B26556
MRRRNSSVERPTLSKSSSVHSQHWRACSRTKAAPRAIPYRLWANRGPSTMRV